MYITREVEIWIDEEDFEEFRGGADVEDLVRVAEALEELHDEHHGGLLRHCFHPACRSAREAVTEARYLAAGERH